MSTTPDAGLTPEQIATIQSAPDGTIFETTLRCKYLCTDAEDIADFAQLLRATADMVAEWQAAGVELAGGQEDDYASFMTEDKAVALRFGFLPMPEDAGEDITP